MTCSVLRGIDISLGPSITINCILPGYFFAISLRINQISFGNIESKLSRIILKPNLHFHNYHIYFQEFMKEYTIVE